MALLIKNTMRFTRGKRTKHKTSSAAYEHILNKNHTTCQKGAYTSAYNHFPNYKMLHLSNCRLSLDCGLTAIVMCKLLVLEKSFNKDFFGVQVFCQSRFVTFFECLSWHHCKLNFICPVCHCLTKPLQKFTIQFKINSS